MAEKIIRDGLGQYSTRVVRSDSELQQMLIAKLEEELSEVKAAPDKVTLLEELADLVEVAFAIGGYMDVEAARTKKKRAKGGFQRGLVMEVQ